MELLKCCNLSINYGSEDIINSLDLTITSEDKIGVIGPNGSGKSSLIKGIIGEVELYRGKIVPDQDLRIGYLSQIEDHSESDSIMDYVLSDYILIERELHKLEAKMSTAKDDLDSILEDYNRVANEFHRAGGYETRGRVEAILSSLGLDNDPYQKMSTLSGGERSLVSFAKCLVANPNLIILDEPGNHLDYLGLAWLEAFIKNFKGGVIIVSHNRYLLDKCCNSILEIKNGSTNHFKGNYSSYKNYKLRGEVIAQRDYEAYRREKADLVKKIKELQSITTSQYNPPAGIVAQLAGAKKRLAGLKELDRPQSDSPIKVDFSSDFSKSKIAIDVKDFSLKFDRPLLESVSFSIRCGERVALVGRNGAGKSSLIKKVIHEGGWENPCLRIGPSQTVGYLSQNPEFDPASETIEDEVRSWGAIPSDEVLKHISRFRFRYGDLDKRLSVLSGGESNRLQLARLIYKGCNFLILDEPTNHMDIDSREAISQGLKEYQGTILVISHDRYFLDNLVNRVLEIDKMRITSYPGNFSDFFNTRYKSLPKIKGRISHRGRVSNTTNMSSEIEDGLIKVELMEKERTNIEFDLEAALSRGDSKAGRVLSNKLEKHNRLIEDLYKKLEAAL